MMAGTLGWTMEAPAATAYAVLPVGVDTIRPAQKSRRLQTISEPLIPHYNPQYNVCGGTTVLVRVFFKFLSLYTCFVKNKKV